MPCEFRYMRYDELWSHSTGASVSAVATDTDYSASWAADGRPGRPYRSSTGTFSITIQATCGEVGAIVVANHNLDPLKLITAFSTSFTAPSETPPDGIPVNPVYFRTPANTTVLTIASTSSANSANPVIGEIFAGKYRTLTRGMRLADAEFTESAFSVDPESEFASIQPYDKGLAQRTLSGSAVVSSSEWADLRDWFRSQRGFSRPSVIIPDSGVNDAWVVTFTNFRYRKLDASLYEVDLSFTEYPRSRW